MQHPTDSWYLWSGIKRMELNLKAMHESSQTYVSGRRCITSETTRTSSIFSSIYGRVLDSYFNLISISEFINPSISCRVWEWYSTGRGHSAHHTYASCLNRHLTISNPHCSISLQAFFTVYLLNLSLETTMELGFNTSGSDSTFPTHYKRMFFSRRS